jgi:hypothetical protein
VKKNATVFSLQEHKLRHLDEKSQDKIFKAIETKTVFVREQDITQKQIRELYKKGFTIFIVEN